MAVDFDADTARLTLGTDADGAPDALTIRASFDALIAALKEFIKAIGRAIEAFWRHVIAAFSRNAPEPPETTTEVAGNLYARALETMTSGSWQTFVAEFTLSQPQEGVKTSDNAKTRAMRLLRSYLSPVQQKQLRYKRKFGVVGSNGGKYVITRYGDVYGMSGPRYATFCLQPFDSLLPDGDVILSKVLFIQSNERQFRRKAPISIYDLDDEIDGVTVRKQRDVLKELCAAVEQESSATQIAS